MTDQTCFVVGGVPNMNILDHNTSNHRGRSSSIDSECRAIAIAIAIDHRSSTKPLDGDASANSSGPPTLAAVRTCSTATSENLITQKRMLGCAPSLMQSMLPSCCTLSIPRWIEAHASDELLPHVPESAPFEASTNIPHSVAMVGAVVGAVLGAASVL